MRQPIGLQLIAICLSVLSMLAMAACANAPWPLRGADAPQPSIEMNVWLPAGSDAERSINQEHIAEFVTANDGISMTVALLDTEVEPLDFLLAGDPTPDLVEVDLARLPELIAAGKLAAFPQALADVTGIPSSLAEAVTDDGLRYCLPKAVQTLGLFYNQALFDEAGLAYPAAGWTWADLRAAAEAIAGLPTVRFSAYGLVLSADPSRWLPFYLQAGGSLAPNNAVNAGALAASLDFYTGLLRQALAIEPSYYGGSWGGPVFGNGRVGMAIEGNWLAAYLEAEFPELAYGVAPLPVGPAGAATVAFGTCYAVPAAAAEQASAFALAAHLASAQSMHDRLAVSIAIPARSDVAIAWEARYPELRALRTQLEAAQIWQGIFIDATSGNDLQRLLEAILADDLTVEEAVNDALASPIP